MASTSSASTSAERPGSLYLPLEDLETPTCELHGMNEARQVVMLGWTKNIPLEFPNLREDLNVKVVNPKAKPETWPKNFRLEMLQNASNYNMKYYADRAIARNNPITEPLKVFVLAKKSIHSIVKDGLLLMFSHLIVGDETGFSILVGMNNSVRTLFRQTQVGDQLLIGDGTFKKLEKSPWTACFNDSLQLALELKVTQYQCRRVFKLEGVDRNIKLPDNLTSGKQLRLPSNLPKLEDLLESSDPGTEYFDIIGVVSFVGRLERIWSTKPNVIPIDAKYHFQHYSAYRWLELIDDNVGTCLPVILYMNDCIWNLQADLTPGCVIIITNVTIPTGKRFGYEHINSSVFTQIYINKCIASYMERMPGVSASSVMKLFGSGRMREILERDNVCWSAGGLYSQPFESETQFCRHFNENVEFHVPTSHLSQRIPRVDIPFARRELQRIHFKGLILKSRLVTVTGTSQYWATENFPSEVYDYKKFFAFYPFLPDRNWYAFSHQFPRVDYNQTPKETLGARTRFNEFASKSYKKFCDPLLMPHGRDMSLKDLPMTDGLPYYWIEIIDAEKRHKYHCIWKTSRHLSLEQMKLKLENARDELVIGVIDIFCIDENEKQRKLEVQLQDFTTMVTLPDFESNQIVDGESSDELGELEKAVQNYQDISE